MELSVDQARWAMSLAKRGRRVLIVPDRQVEVYQILRVLELSAGPGVVIRRRHSEEGARFPSGGEIKLRLIRSIRGIETDVVITNHDVLANNSLAPLEAAGALIVRPAEIPVSPAAYFGLDPTLEREQREEDEAAAQEVDRLGHVRQAARLIGVDLDDSMVLKDTLTIDRCGSKAFVTWRQATFVEAGVVSELMEHLTLAGESFIVGTPDRDDESRADTPTRGGAEQVDDKGGVQ